MSEQELFRIGEVAKMYHRAAEERGAENVAACDYVGIVSGNDTPDKMEKAGFMATTCWASRSARPSRTVQS